MAKEVTLKDKSGAIYPITGSEQVLRKNGKTVEQTLYDLDGIMPPDANRNNRLASQAFVNSSLATNSATFRGTYESLWDVHDVQADANDYIFIVETDENGNTSYKRYKYVRGTDEENINTPNGWKYEYTLNNSSFTAEQWAAINSGVTSETLDIINQKYVKPADGIPNDDLSTEVKTSLEKADTAVRYTSQTLAPVQQAQALDNIGAVGRKTEQRGEVFNDYNHNQALGVHSHAEGYYTTVLGTYAHAEGATNVEDANAIHQVGIPTPNIFGGIDVTTRRDAHNIKQDGRHYILNVGGFDGTNSNAEGVKDLATVIADLESSGGGSGTGVDAYTKSETDNLLATKQDTISDLATIRTNATDGKTAYGWGNHATMGYLTEHQSLADYALKSEIPSTDAFEVTANKVAQFSAVDVYYGVWESETKYPSTKAVHGILDFLSTNLREAIPSIEGLASEAYVANAINSAIVTTINANY